MDRVVNKPIDEPSKRYLRRYSFPFFVEKKFDGERVLLQVSDTITIANKHKTIYSESVLPNNLISAVREAVHKEGLYDAEFYSSRGNLYKFLSARARLSEDLALAIFDIIGHTYTPLFERKQLLKKNITSNGRVHLVRYTICHSALDIIKAKNKAIREGFEGVVVKPNAEYHAKWLKLKEQHTADMVVLAVKKTDSWLKERQPYTFLMGIYQPSGFNPIGDVSSGLDLTERETLATYVPELRLSEGKDYIYLKPELVFEIEYHQKTPNGLREPKIKRIRFDKPPEECKKIG